VVANADRFLPYAPGSFELAMSLTVRRPGPELLAATYRGARERERVAAVGGLAVTLSRELLVFKAQA
jgi:hypothetical protein